PHHATHNVGPFFKRTPLQILQRIPLANYFPGIDSKLLRPSTRRNGGGADAADSDFFADSWAHQSLPFTFRGNGYTKRISTQNFNSKCIFLGAADGLNSLISSGRDYTPFSGECQPDI